MYKVQNETVVENVSIQTLNTTDAVVSIEGIALDPAPFVTLSIDQYRSGDLIVGGVLNVSLNGTIYSPNGGGFSDITAQVRSLLDNIGTKGDCVHLMIQCSGAILVDGFGTITGVDVQEGPDPTWTQLVTYGVNLQLHVNNNDLVVKPNTAASSYINSDELIRDLSENITLSYDNDSAMVDTIAGKAIGKSHVKYNFTISATGAAVGCKHKFTQKTGIEAAEEVVKRRIASIRNGNITSGLTSTAYVQPDLDFYHSGYKYTEIRNLDVDVINGSVSVTGDLIIRPLYISHPYAFVEINMETSGSATEVGKNVSISGTIEGLGIPSFQADGLSLETQFHSASKNKIGNAELAYAGIVGVVKDMGNSYSEPVTDTESCTGGSLLDICSYYVTDLECSSLRINTSSVTRNFGQGTINFSVEMSTAKNCDIAGAARVEIQVSHTYPNQMIAEFTIPFRGEPLIQNLGTLSKETIGVEVTLSFGNTGCADLSNNAVVQNAIACAREKAVETAMNEGAQGWYLTGDSERKSNNGEYSISLEYTRPHPC